MRESHMEQRLRTAMEHAAPDQLDRILSSCNEQKGTVIHMTNKKKTPRRWTSLAVAAALALMVGGFGLRYQSANAVASVVSLDVNPSIELEVNKNEKVLSATALNADAKTVLDGMELKGTQLNVAVNAIVGSLLQNGYLESLSSAILISVEDADTQRASRLQTALTAEVDAALQHASAGAAVLSQTVTYDKALEETARSSSISVGKAALIENIRQVNNKLAFDDLAKLSVEELKQLLVTGAPDLPIGRDAAAQAAQKYAGTLHLSSNVVQDVDSELDEAPAHYEVELHVSGREYDYTVDAYSGKILRGAADVTKPAAAPAPSQPAQADTSAITESRAKSIALNHAGIAEANASGLVVKLDRDDGMLHYDVEFRSGGIEYDYEIKAADGAVLKAEQDVDDDWSPNSAAPSDSKTPPPAAAAPISRDAAQKAAYAHAGVKAAEVSELECELDKEDGRQVYEIEFHVGRIEYDYEIDALTGTILKSEIDRDD